MNGVSVVARPFGLSTRRGGYVSAPIYASDRALVEEVFKR